MLHLSTSFSKWKLFKKDIIFTISKFILMIKHKKNKRKLMKSHTLDLIISTFQTSLYPFSRYYTVRVIFSDICENNL